MTLGEIRSVVSVYNEREKERAKANTINAAFSAYYSALFVRAKSFPSSLDKAFPELFGRTRSGGISADNWQTGKSEMAKIREHINSQRKAADK